MFQRNLLPPAQSTAKEGARFTDVRISMWEWLSPRFCSEEKPVFHWGGSFTRVVGSFMRVVTKDFAYKSMFKVVKIVFIDCSKVFRIEPFL